MHIDILVQYSSNYVKIKKVLIKYKGKRRWYKENRHSIKIGMEAYPNVNNMKKS